MPQIIPMIVTAITTVTSAVVAAGPLAVAAFNAANVIGAAALAGAAFQAIQPDVKSSSTSIEWNADPNAPNRFAFGRIGGAGNIIHNATYGPDKMYVGFVGVMSASGPIKGWSAFKADDAYVSFNGAGMAINSEYANEMWIGRQRGLQPEPSYLPSPSGLKHGAAMPRWGVSYKLSGKAAYIYTLSENSKRSAYKGKVPTGIHIVEGLYCYDPRYDSTYPGGAGGCRLDDPTTWVYSTNAYIHGLNWAIGRWEGQARGISPARYGVPYASMKVGGIGARPDGIDFAAYVEAANVFDENGWACAAWPDADQGKAAVLDSFLQAGGGIYAERQGKISCMHRAAPRTSIVTITADDTAGTIEYDTTTSLLERINSIRPEYWSEAHGWQMVATDEVTAEAWRLEDGQGEPVTRSKGLAYNYVPQSKQARELAALQASHTREPIRGTAPLRHYLDLEVGDCFTFAVPEAVLNGQKVIVLNVDPDLENDIIHVTFASETDGKYPFAFGQADAPPPMPGPQPADNTVTAPLPDDWVIAPRPPGSGGVQVPIIDIVGEVSNSTATAVHFEWTLDVDGVPSPDWISAGIWPPTVTSISVPADPGAKVWIRASYLRGENFSEPTIYGPIIMPGLTAGDVIPTAPVIVGLQDQITTAFGDIFDVSNLVAEARNDLDAVEAEIAAARGGEGSLSARVAAVNQARIDGDTANASAISGVAARTSATEADIIDLENAQAGEALARAEAINQVSAKLTTPTNEYANADLSNGVVGFTPLWGFDGPLPTISNAGDEIRVLKSGGQWTGAETLYGITELSGGGRSVAVAGLGARTCWPVYAGETIGWAVDARTRSGSARWSMNTLWCSQTGENVTSLGLAQTEHGVPDWQRRGLVTTVPADGYIWIEATAVLGWAGDGSMGIADMGLRRPTFARLTANAVDLPAYSAPAGGKQIQVLNASVTAQSLAIIDLENNLAGAGFRKIAEATGGAPAYYEFFSSNTGGYAAIAAPVIALVNTSVGGDPVVAMELVDGKARFYGDLSVQSAESGERTVITTNAFRVFDAANVDRVTLGRW